MHYQPLPPAIFIDLYYFLNSCRGILCKSWKYANITVFQSKSLPLLFSDRRSRAEGSVKEKCTTSKSLPLWNPKKSRKGGMYMSLTHNLILTKTLLSQISTFPNLTSWRSFLFARWTRLSVYPEWHFWSLVSYLSFVTSSYPSTYFTYFTYCVAYLTSVYTSALPCIYGSSYVYLHLCNDLTYTSWRSLFFLRDGHGSIFPNLFKSWCSQTLSTKLWVVLWLYLAF